MKERILPILIDMQINVKEMKLEQENMKRMQEKTIEKLDDLEKEVKINILKILKEQNKNINFFRSKIDNNAYNYKKTIIGYRRKSNIIRKYKYKIKPFNY